MSVPESGKRDVELGPFFSVGVVLVVYGLIRRRLLLVAAGLGSVWLDQRSELGRSVKAKIRAKYMTVQVVRDETSEAELNVQDDGDRAVARDLDQHAGAEDPRRDTDA